MTNIDKGREREIILVAYIYNITLNMYFQGFSKYIATEKKKSLSTSVVVFSTTSVWVFLHLRVAFTTTSVWVIPTSVRLHLYPCTMGPSVAARFEQFLVDLWVSLTLFVGFLFFQLVVL